MLISSLRRPSTCEAVSRDVREQQRTSIRRPPRLPRETAGTLNSTDNDGTRTVVICLVHINSFGPFRPPINLHTCLRRSDPATPVAPLVYRNSVGCHVARHSSSSLVILAFGSCSWVVCALCRNHQGQGAQHFANAQAYGGDCVFRHGLHHYLSTQHFLIYITRFAMILAWHDAQLGGVPCMRVHVVSFFTCGRCCRSWQRARCLKLWPIQ